MILFLLCQLLLKNYKNPVPRFNRKTNQTSPLNISKLIGPDPNATILKKVALFSIIISLYLCFDYRQFFMTLHCHLQSTHLELAMLAIILSITHLCSQQPKTT